MSNVPGVLPGVQLLYDKFIHVLPVEHPFYIRRYVGQVLWSLARNHLAIMLFLRSNSVSGSSK